MYFFFFDLCTNTFHYCQADDIVATSEKKLFSWLTVCHKLRF